MDPANPEVRLLELKKIYTHRSLENHCQYGLFDGLIKGADASFPDEYGEPLLQKARRLGDRDFAEIIALLYKVENFRIFDLLKQINTFDDRGTLIATDRRKRTFCYSVIRALPGFLAFNVSGQD